MRTWMRLYRKANISCGGFSPFRLVDLLHLVNAGIFALIGKRIVYFTVVKLEQEMQENFISIKLQLNFIST